MQLPIKNWHSQLNQLWRSSIWGPRGWKGAMQRAGPRPVLSGWGREHSGLAAVLSLPTGVGGCEC